MARWTAFDFYQNFRFHLVDVSQAQFDSVSVPLLALNPQLGFQSISAPGMAVQHREISPGNDPFPVSTPMGATNSNLTLQRGVYTGEQEFYNWVKQAVAGRGLFRRDLILFQMHRMFSTTDDKSVARLAEVMASLAIGIGQDQFQSALGGDSSLAGAAAGAVVGVSQLLGKPVRFWKLYGCIPVSYSAGQGFDATDDNMTVASLELHVEHFEEYNAGPPAFMSGFSGGFGF